MSGTADAGPAAAAGGTPSLGVCVHRELPAAYTLEAATRLEAAGADAIWVIEDVFYTAGVSLAAAALTRTERLTVGIGILPVVARNPAITAMELATLAGLGPGRLIGGLGHGVQDWMAQMGARVASPLTALDEVTTAVRELLRGATVTRAGRYVNLDGVRLEHPPDPVPPVLAGVQGPRSLELAGRVADGVVLVELTGPTAVREALRAAGREGAARRGFRVGVFSILHVDRDRRTAREAAAAWVTRLVREAGPGTRAAPFYPDLAAAVERDGEAAVVGMPDDWWTELAAVGTPDDVHAHIAAQAAAGVTDLGLFPPPGPAVAREQLERVCTSVL